MLVSQAHSFSQQARLSTTLAWVAGYTNILTIITCGTVTSHITGSASNLGRAVVERSWANGSFMLFLLVAFACGAALSGALTEAGRRRGWPSIYVLPMAVEALLLTLFAVGIELHDPAARAAGPALWWLTGVASLAMGLQNATITRISSGVIRTTHLTGVLTDLGAESVQFLHWLRDRKADSPPLTQLALVHSVRVHPSARRLVLLASIVASFIVGAGLGTLAYDGAPRLSMLPPIAFLLWIVWQDAHTPICEIEPEDMNAGDNGFGLPNGLVVHHLRKQKGRTALAHRLPDLSRWCELLPVEAKVVILDMGEVVRLDSSAALELRALMRQSEARGRKVIVAGMTGEQYHAVRQSGAGDALNPNNVCPDLELAIARGMMLLDEQPRALEGAG